MRENRAAQVQTNMLDCLTLSLIDGHGIGQMYRELKATEWNWGIFQTRVKGHPRNQHHIVTTISIQYTTFQDSASRSNQPSMGSIVKTMDRIQFAQ